MVKPKAKGRRKKEEGGSKEGGAEKRESEGGGNTIPGLNFGANNSREAEKKDNAGKKPGPVLTFGASKGVENNTSSGLNNTISGASEGVEKTESQGGKTETTINGGSEKK